MSLKDYKTFLTEGDKFVVMQDQQPGKGTDTLGVINVDDPEADAIIKTLKNTLMGKAIVEYVNTRLSKAGFGNLSALSAVISNAFNKNFSGTANDLIALQGISNNFPLSNKFNLKDVMTPYTKYLSNGFFDSLYNDTTLKMPGGSAVGKGEVFLSFLADNLYKGSKGDLQDKSSNSEYEIKGGYGAGQGVSGGKSSSGARMGSAESNRDGITQFANLLKILSDATGSPVVIKIGSSWSKTQNKDLADFFNSPNGGKVLGDTKLFDSIVNCFTQYNVSVDSSMKTDFASSAKSAEGLNRFMMKMHIYAYWNKSGFDGILFIDEGSKNCYPINIKSYSDISSAIDTGSFDKSKLEWGAGQQNSAISVTYLS